MLLCVNMGKQENGNTETGCDRVVDIRYLVLVILLSLKLQFYVI